MLRSISLRPIAKALPHARPLLQLNAGSSSSASSVRCLSNLVRPAAAPQLTRPRPTPHRVQSALFRPLGVRLYAAALKGDQLKKEQERHRQEKLKAHPEAVSSTSSVRQVFEPGNPSVKKDDEADMLHGIKSDLATVRETFALHEVPKEVFWFGMGGLAPYVVTSASTLFLAWDMNHASETGMGIFVSKDTASHLLEILEPTQIGLGAIILSFLGAVHWGLEMAKYGGSHPYRRYTIGILAPALAWPTILLPLDYALLTQFVGFVGMYFADSQATTMGWAPRWYTTYRFILTFVVGACIIMTLVGRGQIGDAVEPTRGARQHLADIRLKQRENVQREEDERIARMAAEDRKVKENKQKKSDDEPTDPGKKAAGDQPGKQGMHHDDNQDTSATTQPGQPTDPTPEKKGEQKPREERKAPTGMRG